MKSAVDIILANPITAFVILIIVVGVFILIYKNKKDILKKAALYAVAKAEEAWGSKMGQVKYAEVYSYLKTKYGFITFFISEAQLKQLIEDSLKELKKILETQTRTANIK